jgi:membrane fusion protein (multidrug efflux system)
MNLSKAASRLFTLFPMFKDHARVFILLFCASVTYSNTETGAQPPPTPVDTEIVRVAPIIHKLELSGTVTSPQVSQISTSVEGLIRAVHYDSGASVTAGEVLLELDDELEEAVFQQADARTKQAEAELEDARRRLRIAKNLAARSYGPRNEVEAREAEVQIDAAALESFKALRARQKAILERHKVKAPFAGVISKRMAELGQWVLKMVKGGFMIFLPPNTCSSIF